MNWQPIETAPKDGTWFLICKADEGFESYEIGRYDPMMMDRYVEVEDGLFRKVHEPLYDWANFNNMHRATHWMELPKPPQKSEESTSSLRFLDTGRDEE